MGQTGFEYINAPQVQEKRLIRRALGIEPGAPLDIENPIKSLTEGLVQGTRDTWRGLSKAPPPPVLPSKRIDGALPTPDPVQKPGFTSTKPAAPPGGGSKTSAAFDSLIGMAMEGLKGSRANEAVPALPPAKLDQLQPTAFPEMEMPQQQFTVIGKRPPGLPRLTLHGIPILNNQEADEQAEYERIMKPEFERLEFERGLYKDLMLKRAGMAETQQNAKYAGQVEQAKGIDQVMNQATLSGYGTPMEMARRGRIADLTKTLMPIEQARATGGNAALVAMLGLQREQERTRGVVAGRQVQRDAAALNTLERAMSQIMGREDLTPEDQAELQRLRESIELVRRGVYFISDLFDEDQLNELADMSDSTNVIDEDQF